jgi:hypothetical protein
MAGKGIDPKKGSRMKPSCHLLAVLLFLIVGELQAGGLAKKDTVITYRNLPYCEIPRDPDRERHQLDVCGPKGRTKCPVLFFVHGGAGW